MGTRYEHHCTTSSSSSASRHTCGCEQSTCRRASRRKSGCQDGIFVQIKFQRFVSNAGRDHDIVDKLKFSRQKSLMPDAENLRHRANRLLALAQKARDDNYVTLAEYIAERATQLFDEAVTLERNNKLAS